MRFFLDTHTLHWLLANDVRLGRIARSIIEDTSNKLLLSSIALMEIAIKGQGSHWGLAQ